MIPYGKQQITPEDIAAVVEVLRSDWLTQGPAIERFEQAVAGHCGARHAVAVSNGTAALHLAALAAGLGPGDILWTSPITFVASANCALYCGAAVDFVDIDPASLNMDPAALERKLKAAAAVGKLPKAVVVVHFGGLPCEMERIAALCGEHGVVLIEDACHAIGGAYQGSPIGSCRHSAMTVFSFHPVKIITTGEGGMVTTNDERLFDRLALLRTHGITRDPALMEGATEGPWYYQQVALGFNYRITDMQAALGHSQLSRIDAYVARRNALAARYQTLLAGLPLAFQRGRDGLRSAYHLFVVRLASGGEGRRAMFERLRAAGIGVNVHYIPVHLQPYYRRMGFAAGDFPRAEEYYREALTLPLFPAMTEAEQDFIVGTLKDAIV